MKITNIKWDTDGDEEVFATLPQEIDVPEYFLEKKNFEVDGEYSRIEYRCVGQEKFVDGWPGGCTFNGKVYTRFVQAIITCIDSECLHDLAAML